MTTFEGKHVRKWSSARVMRNMLSSSRFEAQARGLELRGLKFPSKAVAALGVLASLCFPGCATGLNEVGADLVVQQAPAIVMAAYEGCLSRRGVKPTDITSGAIHGQFSMELFQRNPPQFLGQFEVQIDRVGAYRRQVFWACAMVVKNEFSGAHSKSTFTKSGLTSARNQKTIDISGELFPTDVVVEKTEGQKALIRKHLNVEYLSRKTDGRYSFNVRYFPVRMSAGSGSLPRWVHFSEVKVTVGEGE